MEASIMVCQMKILDSSASGEDPQPSTAKMSGLRIIFSKDGLKTWVRHTKKY